MTYPDLSTVNATNDLSQLLIYANTVTDGIFMPGMLFAFFCVIWLGSYFAQLRFTGKGKFDASFTVAGFSTFGMSVLMMLSPGLIGTQYVVMSLAVSLIGVIWMYFSNE